MIEFAALLLVSTLFGGMMLYSFGFAPMVFSALPAEDAGRFIRAAFPWYYLFVVATAGLGGAILLRSNPRSGALALAIAIIGIFARQVLMPWINTARDMQLQRIGEAKRRFSRLHGIRSGARGDLPLHAELESGRRAGGLHRSANRFRNSQTKDRPEAVSH